MEKRPSLASRVVSHFGNYYKYERLSSIGVDVKERKRSKNSSKDPSRFTFHSSYDGFLSFEENSTDALGYIDIFYFENNHATFSVTHPTHTNDIISIAEYVVSCILNPTSPLAHIEHATLLYNGYEIPLLLGDRLCPQDIICDYVNLTRKSMFEDLPPFETQVLPEFEEDCQDLPDEESVDAPEDVRSDISDEEITLDEEDNVDE